MDLSYLGSMKENNLFLSPTIPDDIEVIIGNMKVNKVLGPNNIPTKILKDYKSEFSKLLVIWSILLLQQVYSLVPLK